MHLYNKQDHKPIILKTNWNITLIAYFDYSYIIHIFIHVLPRGEVVLS